MTNYGSMIRGTYGFSTYLMSLRTKTATSVAIYFSSGYRLVCRYTTRSPEIARRTNDRTGLNSPSLIEGSTFYNL